jgi:hypothetical protein
MCYDNCEHFRFNPMTGEDRCVSTDIHCPGEEPEDDEEENEDE